MAIDFSKIKISGVLRKKGEDEEEHPDTIFSKKNIDVAKEVGKKIFYKTIDFFSQQAINVKDFATGELEVTGDDIFNIETGGVSKTIEGVATTGKMLSQETFAGLSRIGKTAMEAVGMEAPSSEFEEVLLGSKTRSYQQFAEDISPTLDKLGANENEKKAIIGSIAVGGFLLDLPGGSSGKNVIKKLVKETTEEGIEAIMRAEMKSIPEEVIQASKKMLAEAGDEELVKVILTNRMARYVDDTAKTGARAAGDIIEGETESQLSKRLRGVSNRYNDKLVGNTFVPRNTSKLSRDARDLIKTNFDEAFFRATNNADDESVAISMELINDYNRKASLAKNATEAENFYNQAADVANSIIPKLTESGRTVQAASLLASMTPAGQLTFAARTIKNYNRSLKGSDGLRKMSTVFGFKKEVPELTGKQAKDLYKEADELFKMVDGEEKAIKAYQFQKKVANLVPSPWWQKAQTLYQAGLLTGIQTSGLNTISNSVHGMTEVMSDIPGSFYDVGISFITGKRTLALTGRGLDEGVVEGFKKGWKYVKTGYNERNLAIKFDHKKLNWGESKIGKGLEFYEQSIFRLLGAQDQVFYYGAKAHSLYSQAIAESINQKLKGKAKKAFVEKMVYNPTDDMIKMAVNDAEMSVFQNRTVLGNIGTALQKAIPGGKFIIPFARTPSAIAMQIVNYSPAGFIKTTIQNIGKGRFNQRNFARGMGRATVGSGAFLVGMGLMSEDRISLDYPDSESERKQWELEGRKAWSIKMGNKWRDAEVLGPAGLVMLLGAGTQLGIEKTGTITGGLKTALSTTMGTVRETTFAEDLSKTIDSLLDENRWKAFSSYKLASAIPAIIGKTAETSDPLQRRTHFDREGFFAPSQSKIPGLRQELEPKIDTLGRPVERAGNAWETLLDPTRPTRIKSGEVVDELKRLYEAGYEATPTDFDEKYMNGLPPEEKTQLIETAGKILEQKLVLLLNHDAYEEATDEEKTKTIRSYANQTRNVARAGFILSKIKDLKGAELKAKLSEFKQSGLLNETVYNLVQEYY